MSILSSLAVVAVEPVRVASAAAAVAAVVATLRDRFLLRRCSHTQSRLAREALALRAQTAKVPAPEGIVEAILFSVRLPRQAVVAAVRGRAVRPTRQAGTGVPVVVVERPAAPQVRGHRAKGQTVLLDRMQTAGAAAVQMQQEAGLPGGLVKHPQLLEHPSQGRVVVVVRSTCQLAARGALVVGALVAAAVPLGRLDRKTRVAAAVAAVTLA